MPLLEFLLGLALGLGLWAGCRWRLKRQLSTILQFSPDAVDLIPVLSIPSLVRRETTYLKQLVEQREREAILWEEIADCAPYGLLRIDADNYLLWCNSQARKWLQIDRWQPDKRRLLLELVRSSELDRLIEETRQSQAPRTREWKFYPSPAVPHADNPAKSTDWAPQYLKGYGYPLPQGEVALFIENQQSLKEFSQNRNRFFSDLTHELRTPLTSLSLLAETLAQRLAPAERRWAVQMGGEIERLMQLVQDWLDLAQLQGNPQQSLNVGEIELATPILEAWQILKPLADEKAIALDLPDLGNLPFKNLPFKGDATRLKQVFLNLLDNSIKHSPPQSTLALKVETTPSQIVLHLIDCGPGFALQDLPHVFDRLYRGDASRTRLASDAHPKRSSSGLGLAIAQGIIQAHGGSITAQNHPETGGAWLTVTLPRTHKNSSENRDREGS